jgi:leader peptidase (prepilin peptidase)/N-methyltransferase
MSGFESLIGAFVFIFGAIVGSFLNVCIYRMPIEKSIVRPRSFCPHCRKQIPWYDNVPFLSYIVLGGRCRFCRKPISIRYFMVELLTAGLFLFLYFHYGLQWVLLPYWIFVSGLVVAAFVDLEHRIIPDEISLGGIVMGFVLSCLIPALHGFSVDMGSKAYLFSAGKSLLGILIGGGSIYAMGMIGDFIFKKETMGGGDVKLMGMVGAFLGWQAALLAFFIAPFFGAIFGIIVKIKTKESVIPYGPFLALGAFISLIWGREIIGWILSGYGLY